MDLFGKFCETFLSKLTNKLVDFALSEKDKATFESLRSTIRLLCAKAIDIEAAIRKDELSSKKKRKREVDNWLKQVQTIESEFRMQENEIQMEGFVRQFFNGGRATILEAEAQKLVEQSRHFGDLVLDGVYNNKGERLLVKGLVGEQFDKNLKTILRFLLEENMPSIGVYGMGGVGKTTLAKYVNNRLVERDQEHVVWITVSQEFTISMLQDEIAKSVGLDLSNEHDEDKRATRLNRVLSKIRNLVFIFDDLWKTIDLIKLGDPLSVDGCRLLITTRSQQVCHQIQCKKLIKVRTLEDNEAWNLFRDTLGQEINLSPEVQEIAKSMVKLCDGLPLGIITIAGSMKGGTEIHTWKDAWAELQESVMSHADMEEHVFKVLKYSFDGLNRHEGKNNGYSKFQQCFLYCSLYPEDMNINRDELIRKFILENLLDKRESKKALYIQGHAILDKLVNVCLLERVGDFGVKMHDLVRAMALKVTESTTKVIAGHYTLKEIPIEEGWTKDLEKMSLMYNGITKIRNGVSPYCPKLSTLILKKNPLRFISNSFFLQIRGLFILDLSGTKIKKLSDSLSNMESLKALLLENCYRLNYVPYLGKLKELKELDLTSNEIQKMPQGMEQLCNLKFLSLERCGKLGMLPRGLLLNFRHLQCLFLPIHLHAPMEGIQELKHLEEFRGRVEDACDFSRLINSRPCLLYCIVIGPDFRIVHFAGYNELHFSEYDFNSWEDEDATILVQDIKKLELVGCKGLRNGLAKYFSQLSNPKSIESLYIHECDEIECLLRIEQFLNRGVTTFASALPLARPYTIFSSLSILCIWDCKRMKNLGLLASQLQNLRSLSIGGCEMMEEIIDVREEIGLEQSFVISLPKLENLSLQLLPRLKSICNAKIMCSSITMITLRSCSGLKKLPLVFGQPHHDSPPSALKDVVLCRGEEEWWEKLELGHPSHHSLLQSFIQWWN